MHGVVSDEKNGESIIPPLMSRYIDKFWRSCGNNCNTKLTPPRWSKNLLFMFLKKRAVTQSPKKSANQNPTKKKTITHFMN